jgi:HD superfamily phosphohydrolase
MYWQVYVHKTAVAAEKMMINTLNRAKFLTNRGVELEATIPLKYFLCNQVDKQRFESDPEAIRHFTDLDDNDIWCALKAWTKSSDKVLFLLCTGLINRNLFKIEVSSTPISPDLITEKTNRFCKKYNLSQEDAAYLILSESIATHMYNEADDSIDILYKDESTEDISSASDMLNIQLLSKKIKKYYFCFLRDSE